MKVGAHLGPYEVTGPLGAGGMGEVYRARDTSLKRDVAIKVLPASFASDADRLARFQREAEVLASLNHPNIAQIYGIERSESTTALAMELVEGPTLAERIAQGPIPVDEAIGLALQMAEALEAAHGRGIVHRDLKPANIKLTPDGVVKVLDFGIAKAPEPPPTSGGRSPTLLTPALTEAGVLLGTAAYMAPEQARGRAVDQRADIWAFGCVLYEMLTGQPAFGGEDVTTTLARILERGASLEALPTSVQPSVRHTLALCLEKDVRRRLADIRDVRLGLIGTLESVSPRTDTAEASRWSPRHWVLAAGVLLAAISLTILADRALLRAPPDAEPVRRSTLAAVETMPIGFGFLLALSPSGETLVYRGIGPDRIFRAYRHDFDRFEARPIPGTENSGTEMLFSEDGNWLAFTGADGSLMRVAIEGGRPIRIASMPRQTRGSAWRGNSIFVGARRGGLVRIDITGGPPETIATAPEGVEFSYPHLLPNEQFVLFTASRIGERSGDLTLMDVATGERRVVLADAIAGRYVSTGHVVFVRDGDLWAAPFDLERQEIVGSPVVVEQNVWNDDGTAQMSIAADGALAYINSAVVSASNRTISLLFRSGEERPLSIAAGDYANVRVSPDGRRLAFTIGWETGTGSPAIWDNARETLSRLTFDSSAYDTPIWFPEGDKLAFSMAGRLVAKNADNTGAIEPLVSDVGDGAEPPVPYFFTESGQQLVFGEIANSETGDNIGLVPLTPGAATQWLLREPFNERNAALSPDGRWMAYQSDETGRDEIYVRPFPNVGDGFWQVSTDGGKEPVWSREGRELLYVVTSQVDAADQDGAVMVVPVAASTMFQPGTARRLMRWPGRIFADFRDYDVSADDQSLVVIRSAVPDDGTIILSVNRPRIRLVEHWFEELKRLAPAEGRGR